MGISGGRPHQKSKIQGLFIRKGLSEVALSFHLWGHCRMQHMLLSVGPKVSDEETEAHISWTSNGGASMTKQNETLESFPSSSLPVQGLGWI